MNYELSTRALTDWHHGPFYVPVSNPDVRVANGIVWLRAGDSFRAVFTGKPDEADAAVYARWKGRGAVE